MKRKPPTAMQRKPSALELHAAAQAATHRGRELPDPLWPGHVLEEVKAPEPDCAACRADNPLDLRTEVHSHRTVCS